MIDGNVKMSEHLAIMRYIARKYGLAPTTEDETILSDQTENFVFDIRFRFYQVAYNTKNYEAAKTEFLDIANKRLLYLDAQLGKNDYVVGNRLTYVDVVVFDFLLLMRAFEPELVTKNPNLARFVERIQKLPRISEYLTSNRFRSESNICAPFATWNGRM